MTVLRRSYLDHASVASSRLSQPTRPPEASGGRALETLFDAIDAPCASRDTLFCLSHKPYAISYRLISSDEIRFTLHGQRLTVGDQPGSHGRKDGKIPSVQFAMLDGPLPLRSDAIIRTADPGSQEVEHSSWPSLREWYLSDWPVKLSTTSTLEHTQAQMST